MPDAPSSTTIRFSCECGAAFEVSRDQAGRLGRCGRCGKEMLIPEASEPQPTPLPLTPTPHVEQPPSSVRKQSRFCPFCGQSVRANARVCPSCFKKLSPEKGAPKDQPRLTVLDWVLSTVFAPLGCIGGFVLLVMGTRKGLDMMGISTVSIFAWWCIAVLVGWIG